MSETTHAVLDGNGTVTNLVVLDDETQWDPPEGHTLQPVTTPGTSIGDRWDGDAFSPPAATPVEPPAPDEAFEALQAQVDELTRMMLEGQA